MENEIKKTIKDIISRILEINPAEMDENTHFGEFGFESIAMTEMAGVLDAHFGIIINETHLYEFNTIDSLAGLIDKELTSRLTEKEKIGVQTEQKVLSLDIEKRLTELASLVIDVQPDDFQPDAHFGEMGYESVTMGELAGQISREFNLPVTPLLLYEKNTIRALTEYLKSIKEPDSLQTPVEKNVNTKLEYISPVVQFESRKKNDMPAVHDAVKTSHDDIAIIGMAAKFPQSDSLEEFWNHLLNKRCVVGSIPAERKELYNWQKQRKENDPAALEAQGGFMRHVDHFDPLFFNISPKEAELMDPQQRIFMQIVWAALEEAGCSKSSLAGTDTGVFVGISSNDYTDLMMENKTIVNAFTATGKAYSILANRISYYFDFHGPSQPVDTACSSSLTALHYAVTSLKAGECSLAIAGGVNVLLSPSYYQSFIDAGMLSPDGRCKTFDKSANGYARGEGAGAVVLKPLAQALKDGNHIHGIIKSTAINHGGRAHSLTAPNIDAQAQLIVTAYQKSGIDPATIGYIEAHGTGTRLGDPIEINALKKAFATLYRDSGKTGTPAKHCAIGAVKTNIGHLEAAAGIAGVFKVLLAMKHKVIPGISGFRELNPLIDLEGSPFYIADKNYDWAGQTAPDGNRLRRAGVSSFGFGGANAHIVIEEYPCNSVYLDNADWKGTVAVVLSARDPGKLKESAKRLHACLLPTLVVNSISETEKEKEVSRTIRTLLASLLHVETDDLDDRDDLSEVGVYQYLLALLAEQLNNKYPILLTGRELNRLQNITEIIHYVMDNLDSPQSTMIASPVTDVRLDEIAYTLQQGREAMEERLAMVVETREALIKTLQSYINDEKPPVNLFQSNINSGRAKIHELFENEEGKEYIETLYRKHKIETLAKLWTEGASIDWKRIYEGHKPQLVCLPAYPFAEESYWIPAGTSTAGSAENRLSAQAALHPLLHSNLSDIHELKFKSVFTGEEFFFSGHVVMGKRVLPGVAYLEMVHAALSKAGIDTDSGFSIKGMVWAAPFTIDGTGNALHITLEPWDDGSVYYQIQSNDILKNLHASGAAYVNQRANPPVVDLNLLKSGMRLKEYPAQECYIAMEAMGFDLGQSFKSIQTVYAGNDGILTRLICPQPAAADWESFYLHPSIVDGALQSQIILMMNNRVSENRLPAVMPFTLGELIVYSKPEKQMWAHVRYHNGKLPHNGISTLDINMFNDSGELCLEFTELSFKEIGTVVPGKDAQDETLLFEEQWNKVPDISPAAISCDVNRTIVLCTTVQPDLELLKKSIPDSEIIVYTSSAENTAELYLEYSTQLFGLLKRITSEKQESKALIQVLVSHDRAPGILQALSALLKTVTLEYPLVRTQLLETDRLMPGSTLLNRMSLVKTPDHFRYTNGSFEYLTWKEQAFVKDPPLPWKENGVYLITGGLGSIGMIHASAIARHCPCAHIILCNRNEPDAPGLSRIELLRKQAADIEYRKADLTDLTSTRSLINSIIQTHTTLNGIIHCAGIIRDNYIRNKDEEEFRSVLGPKVLGAVFLDELTRDIPLDFMVYFSSVAAVMGNPGQADYACANSFMDAYAQYRESLVSSGKRSGRTLSINWPHWKEGGMAIPPVIKQKFYETTGLSSMDTQDALKILYQSIANGKPRVFAAYGNKAGLLNYFIKPLQDIIQTESVPPGVTSSAVPGSSAKELKEKLIGLLSHKITELSGMKRDKIDTMREFSHYGLTSISLTEFTGNLNKQFSLNLLPTLLFDHPTLARFTDHLLEKHMEVFLNYFGMEKAQEHHGTRKSTQINTKELSAPVISSSPKLQGRFDRVSSIQKRGIKNTAGRGIAIIGMSGQFPMAPDIQTFWENIVQGKDCISIVPRERWDWEEYFGDPLLEPNKSNVKWGGFIDGVDCFDPQFFGISPREAELMDPQQRLLMIHTWKAIEDAGYSTKSLEGTSTALFAGTAHCGYTTMITKLGIPVEAYTSTGTVPSVGPNRMSYLLDLHGPSEPIETACSSSLVAILRAVQAIESGLCTTALAGGVNTMLSPDFHISFSKAGMLSIDGKCKTFSDKANGYVRGEGAGMLLLKELDQAEKDQDNIYAVIKAGSENHGGRANSLTAPNSKAQAQLLVDAYHKAGFDPSTVTYIEAHGTGTKLGDPVEIEGLKSAFAELYREAGIKKPGNAVCGLGSVKTNIGHLELSAGVAGIIKVVMQMKHKKLVKSLHCETVNPYIKLEGSPFYILQENREWIPLKDKQGNPVPRRAGVSSFGFGGVNAHIVLEEYLPDPVSRKSNRTGNEVYPILLSAKNKSRLNEQVKQLLLVLRGGEYQDKDLPAIAYTLATGRDAMEERLAVLARTIVELDEKLSKSLNQPDPFEAVYRGNVKTSDNTLPLFSSDEYLQEAVTKWMEDKKYNRLLELWVKGLAVDWKALYTSNTPRRVHLPTYPFAQERYWLNTDKRAEKKESVKKNQVSETSSVLTFEELWIPKVLDQSKPAQIMKAICLVPGESAVKAVRNFFKDKSPGTGLTFISRGSDFKKFSGDHYSVNKQIPEHYQRAFEELKKQGEQADVVIDFRLLEETDFIDELDDTRNIIRGMAHSGFQYRSLLLSAAYNGTAQRAFADSLGGFVKSSGMIPGSITIRLVFLELANSSYHWIDSVCSEALYAEEKLVCIEQNVRKIPVFAGTQLSSSPGSRQSLLKEGGTYLITGGTAKLGLLFAGYLAETYRANLILTGRRAANTLIEQELENLRKKGSGAVYIQADVSNSGEMKLAADQGVRLFGPINGIIHAAGTMTNGTILDNTVDEFQSVLKSKITGTIILNSLCEDLKADFICYFSSIAAVIGDMGECAYSIGNRFMLACAQSNIQAGCQRIALCWPYWQSGGLGFTSVESVDQYLKATGQLLLGNKEGLDVFKKALNRERSRETRGDLPVIVFNGNPLKIRRMLGISSGNNQADKPKEAGTLWKDEMKGLSLLESIEWDLTGEIGNLLKIERGHIDPGENLTEYGFDSISLAQLAGLLKQRYNIDASPSLFYSYTNIKKLVQYLEQSHHEKMKEAFSAIEESKLAIEPLQAEQEEDSKPGAFDNREDEIEEKRTGHEQIAVIGMSGRFAGARNIEELWDNLVNARCLIDEIPIDRFDYTAYYGNSDPDKNINAKWSANLPGYKEFDPLFFEISPQEAALMDPRQRLLLQEAWLALEDAGIGKEELSKSVVGMFAGVEQGYYHEKTGSSANITSNHNGILASRLAYILDLKGPVMAIDTACSSGLTALHQAIMSIRNGECDTAVIGVVNLLYSADPFIAMSKAGMLSPDGVCYAFDKRANGLVPGEAAAAVVIKRLDCALRDADPVYAVIAASGINYDGKTNGITAPNGFAQSQLLKNIYTQYRIDPEDIGYLVAHGTGTKLGDPVEVNAANDAFRTFTDRQGYCALGSVKPNLGHTLSASGLVSLIAALQAMVKETIPAGINCLYENEYIHWSNSPFYVNKSNKEWPLFNGKKALAAVSSFGMSGTNAHVVLKRYDVEPVTGKSADPSYLFVLSAKTKESLTMTVSGLLDFITLHKEKVSLERISYTLLQGRHHHQYRLAFGAADIETLLSNLRLFIQENNGQAIAIGKVPGIFKENKDERNRLDQILESLTREDIKGYLQKLGQAAQFFCMGYEINAGQLYSGKKIIKEHLPGYAFAREEYWTDTADKDEHSTGKDSPRTIKGYPLLSTKTRDGKIYRFTTLLTGKEIYLEDHIINGLKVFPGTGYLEMVVEGLKNLYSKENKAPVITLCDIAWVKPLFVESEPVEVILELDDEDQTGITFKITTVENRQNTTLHCIGHALLNKENVPEKVDPDLIGLHSSKTLYPGDFYSWFEKAGFQYGKSFQGIKSAQINNSIILADIEILEDSGLIGDQYSIYPGLLDSAMQASVGFELSDNILPALFLPFALDSYTVYKPGSLISCAVIHKNNEKQLSGNITRVDIQLCDRTGDICAVLEGLSFKLSAGKPLNRKSSGNSKTLLFKPFWMEKSVIKQTRGDLVSDHLVIFCECGDISPDRLKERIPGIRVSVLKEDKNRIDIRFKSHAVEIFKEIQSILKSKPRGPHLIQVILLDEEEKRLFGALSGLLKTASLENPLITGQVIEVDRDETDEGVIAKILENRDCMTDHHIRYNKGERKVSGWKEIAAVVLPVKTPWKDNGVYLITGGAGGLGMIFASEITNRAANASIILAGRLELTQERKDKIRSLERNGCRLIYHRVDITKEQDVKTLISRIAEEQGHLNGIIHTAGVIRDNYIIRKTAGEVEEVMGPKVSGVIHLDNATKELDLDFFVLFSSTSGSLGNPGQADYSAANAFLDAYAEYRYNLELSYKRHGKSLSINWPLWKEGGMRIDDKTRQVMTEKTGMGLMDTESGIEAFYRILESGEPGGMVIAGDQEKIERFYGINNGNGYSMSLKEPDFARELSRRVINGEITEEEFEKILTESI